MLISFAKSFATCAIVRASKVGLGLQGKVKLLALLHSSSEACLAKLGVRVAALQEMLRQPGDLASLEVTLPFLVFGQFEQ